MHTVFSSEVTRVASAQTGRLRVGVAGATGYTGQELLRLLARHPGVVITAATSSGRSSGTAMRTLPALRRLWDGDLTPLDPEALARETDLVFMALPDSAAAELAPALVAQGRRVIDLSGTFRLKDAALRARWYPDTGALPDGLAYGLTEHFRSDVRQARLYYLRDWFVRYLVNE